MTAPRPTARRFRKHYKDVHHTRVSCKCKAFDLDLRKQQNREASKRYREKKSCEVAIQNVVKQRKPYIYRHTEQRGGHLLADALLEVKTFQIPEGGNGVFACVDLVEKDIVTWYAGTKTKEAPEDLTYTIKL